MIEECQEQRVDVHDVGAENQNLLGPEGWSSQRTGEKWKREFHERDCQFKIGISLRYFEVHKCRNPCPPPPCFWLFLEAEWLLSLMELLCLG